MSSAFDPEAMLRLLSDHSVEYVLIGGLAGTLHGSPHVTMDADVTPSPDPENLERLSAALHALEARVRVEGVEGGVPFDPHPTLLARVSLLNLTTRYGDLDLTFEPSGVPGGYDELLPAAEAIDIRGVPLLVASLPDIIRSKEAANREKDRITLPTLRELLRRSKTKGAGA